MTREEAEETLVESLREDVSGYDDSLLETELSKWGFAVVIIDDDDDDTTSNEEQQ